MHETRARILRMLMHQPSMGFNELWNKEGESNKFAYHLKILEEDGLVKKEDEHYSLTHEGKKEVAYIDGGTGEKEKAPLLVVIVILEKDGKYLMIERKKEPFYGYWGFVGGKVKVSQYLYETAAEEMKEETGLECDFELKGLFSSKSFTDGNITFNHQIFIVKGTNPRGNLLPETREGINRWIDPNNLDEMKLFPNVLHSIEIANSERFQWVEADRFLENDEFKDIDIKRNVQY